MTEQNSTAADQSSGANQATAAVYLDITQPRVAQFVKDGTFKKLPNGKLHLDQCRIAYIRWLRDDTRKSSASAAAGRLADERAEEIRERRLQRQGAMERAGQEAALAVMDAVIGPLRADLTAMPARVTADLRLRRAIEDQLDVIFAAANRRALAAADRIEPSKAPANRKARRLAAKRTRGGRKAA